jgi:DNA phosphorothioation-dependent restriction protein DptH
MVLHRPVELAALTVQVQSWCAYCPPPLRPLLRRCENLVNGLVHSRHSLGESISGKTSPLRVCARGDIKSVEGVDAVPMPESLGEVAGLNENGLSVSDVVPSICLGSDTLTGVDVRWSLTVKGNPHLLVAGLPGMGKTTCLLNLCKQMLTTGIRPIVFSYHQDIDEKLERLVDSVRFIDFHGLGFNPLQVKDRESRMAYLDVAGILRDIFAAIFPEIGDIQAERIRRAIKDSFVEAGWDAPNAPLASLKEPEFKRFLELLKNDPKPDRGLRTLLARLEELADYGFFDIGESRKSLWDSEQPIVIRIHSTQNDNLQKAFASLVFYGLYKDMFRRGLQDRITHAVIFDEAHRAAGLSLIPTMAKECRKYGVSLVVASQEARDFNISLFSAIANYLVLRVTDVDARALVRNVASSLQERSLIDRIKQMDRFKALYFSEGKSRPSIVSLMS